MINIIPKSSLNPETAIYIYNEGRFSDFPNLQAFPTNSQWLRIVKLFLVKKSGITATGIAPDFHRIPSHCLSENKQFTLIKYKSNIFLYLLMNSNKGILFINNIIIDEDYIYFTHTICKSLFLLKMMSNNQCVIKKEKVVITTTNLHC